MLDNDYVGDVDKEGADQRYGDECLMAGTVPFGDGGHIPHHRQLRLRSALTAAHLVLGLGRRVALRTLLIQTLAGGGAGFGEPRDTQISHRCEVECEDCGESHATKDDPAHR